MFTKDSRRGDKFKKVARHFNVTLKTPRDDNDLKKGNGRRINQQVAEETCEILKNGTYTYNGKIVNINIEASETFDPRSLALIRKNLKASTSDTATTTDPTTDPTTIESTAKTKFVVVQTTTVDAIHRFNSPDKKLTVLNFASAKNPGGGFLKGSQAQEESLARATGLSATIVTSPMYEANEKDNRKCLYQEYLIYSPNVPVFRDSDDELIEEPVYVDIISVPAVNEGEAVRKGVSKTLIDQTRFDRMDSFLAVLKSKNVKRLILGAWGCGVFGGKFQDVANDYYAHLIEGKYKDVFEEIIFAVLEDDDVAILEEYFLD